MEIELTTEAQKDLEFWKLSNNESVLRKIRILLESIQISPFRGIGKPEALKHELAGKWSRRITKEHRIVYSIENKTIYIFSLRGHY
jgi:toxin YoeB